MVCSSGIRHFLLATSLMAFVSAEALAARSKPIVQSKRGDCSKLLQDLPLASEELDVNIYYPSIHHDKISGYSQSAASSPKRSEVVITKATARFGGRKNPPLAYEKIEPEFLRKQGLSAEIRARLSFVYAQYEKRGVVSPAEIKFLREVDDQLDPLRTSYISFDHPEDGKPFFFLRIYDGVEKPAAPGWANLPLPTQSSAKLPLEKEYSALRLPKGDKIEIGRAARDPESLDDLHTIFAWVDRWIQVTYLEDGLRDPNRDFMIYAECVKSRLEWYVREHGFKVVAGSERPVGEAFTLALADDFQVLPEMKSGEARFILRIPRQEFAAMNFDFSKFHEKTPRGRSGE